MSKANQETLRQARYSLDLIGDGEWTPQDQQLHIVVAALKTTDEELDRLRAARDAWRHAYFSAVELGNATLPTSRNERETAVVVAVEKAQAADAEIVIKD